MPILRRLIDLLGQLAPRWSGSIEDLHFAYQAVMETAYKLRDEPGWLDLTVWAARSQVAIGPQVAAAMRAEYRDQPLPRHVGFERLAVLADKAGDDEEVLIVRSGHRSGMGRHVGQARGEGQEAARGSMIGAIH